MNAPDPITFLRTQSLTTLVHESLERQIAFGQLQPDTPLREASIAAEMGISRGPVREAFRMLEERGLVVFEKNCGVRVRKLDLEQAGQIYQVRIPLELLIGQLVAADRNAPVLDGLSALLEQMSQCVEKMDVAAYTALNFDFHDLLAKSTGNHSLYDIYRRLVVQLKLFRSYTFRHNPETIRQSLLEHTAIVAAIKQGDADRAGELLEQHAKESLHRLRLVASAEE